MIIHKETRRTAGQGSVERASELLILGGDNSEYITHPILFNQAAAIARRFVVSEALARTIAEHAYSARPAR